MRIGLVSDTHGDIDTTHNAVRVFDRLQVDLVIHCGDICTPAVISLFSSWPLHFVFGNMDDPARFATADGSNGATCYDRFGHLSLKSRSLAFLHGDNLELLEQTIQSGQWDLVCHGHTHVAAQYSQGRTLVVNPGAIQRTDHPSVAVVELPSLDVNLISL